jgi:hypothetical protein
MEILDIFIATEESKKVTTTTIWYIDSGASQHITSNKNLFHGLEAIHEKKIRVGNNNIITAKMKGSVTITIGGTQTIISDVLYTPGIAKNLLAVRRLTAAGFRLLFVDNYCDIMDGNNTLLTRVWTSNNTYQLPQEDSANFIQEKNATLAIWHKKLGHLGYQNLKLLQKKNLTEDIFFSDKEETFCEACL